jgi:hypothetical protein
MVTKRNPKSQLIKARIAILQAELLAAQADEKQRDREALLRLIDRADCLADALNWARQKIADRRAR